MKKILLIVVALLSIATTSAQQFKTGLGVTTITSMEKPKKIKQPKNFKDVLLSKDQMTGFQQSVEAGIRTYFDYGIFGTFGIVEYIAGYRFNNFFFVGGGAGFGYCISQSAATFSTYGTATFSIYANSRIYFTKTKCKPFIDLPIGVNRDYDEINLHFNPSIGASYKISEKLDFYVSVGYQFIFGLTANVGFTF